MMGFSAKTGAGICMLGCDGLIAQVLITVHVDGTTTIWEAIGSMMVSVLNFSCVISMLPMTMSGITLGGGLETFMS